jgi:hypothetical protein
MNTEDIKGRMSKTQDEIKNGTQNKTNDVAELTKLVTELAAGQKRLMIIGGRCVDRHAEEKKKKQKERRRMNHVPIEGA